MNPVLRREAVERWRGWRAPAVLTAFLVVLALILYGLYQISHASLRSGFLGGADAAFAGPLLGRFLVESLLSAVLLLVLFVTPAYAAAQVVGERERRTLPLLQATLLSPTQIVLGKLWASVAWTALLVAAALPLAAISLFFGGVEVGDVVAGILCLLVLAVALAGMALGISAVTRRTTAAVVLTYALVMALLLGTGFVTVVQLATSSGGGVSEPYVLYLNPYVPLAGAVDAADPREFGSFGLPSPLTPFAAAIGVVEDGPDAFDGGPVVQEATGRRWSWLWGVAFYLLCGVAGVVVAIRRVAVHRPLGRAARRAAPAPAPAPGGGHPA